MSSQNDGHFEYELKSGLVKILDRVYFYHEENQRVNASQKELVKILKYYVRKNSIENINKKTDRCLFNVELVGSVKEPTYKLVLLFNSI